MWPPWAPVHTSVHTYVKRNKIKCKGKKKKILAKGQQSVMVGLILRYSKEGKGSEGRQREQDRLEATVSSLDNRHLLPVTASLLPLKHKVGKGNYQTYL